LALCGQQSISSIAAISAAVSADFMTEPTPLAAGNTATDTAIVNANMMRATFMLQENSRLGALCVK
jgi:hypothetical protein